MSKDFKHNEMMDSKFTCDGKNISPHLKWDGAPTETKSFAISCNDPDAPAGDWIHWLVHGIQPNLTEIPQGGPISGTEVDNDFRRPKYGGPCPPSGTHRYFFRVYALKIAKLEGVSKKNFMDLVKKNTLESAEIIGLYKRKK